MAKKTRGFLALGLMSGTSADGLTVCAFDARRRKIGCFKNYPYSKKLQDKILSALNCKAPALSALNFELGLLYADTVSKFIKEFKIKKDVLVKFVVNAIRVTGCSDEVIISRLGLTTGKLKNGDKVTLEFTPTKSGVLPFSCWMGMINGRFIVE